MNEDTISVKGVVIVIKVFAIVSAILGTIVGGFLAVEKSLFVGIIIAVLNFVSAVFIYSNAIIIKLLKGIMDNTKNN